MSLTFIGPVAEQGGPAIKNALTLKYLGASDVNLINTYSTSISARLRSLASTVFCRDRRIILGVSRKGRALLWPVVELKSRFDAGLRYGLVCIGGTVAEEAAENPRLVRAMKRADVVAVETLGVKEKLVGLGISENVYHFPNFVEGLGNSCVPHASISQTGSLRCVFLSSVRDKKGVRTMVNACQKALAAGCNITLDIYGPIKTDFDRSILDRLDCNGPICYRGVVPKDKVTATLAGYDCFVFPSEYEAEGFPSVLAEAMAVGLPVIASDVCYNPEIVGADGGWIFRAGDIEELANLFAECAGNRPLLDRISDCNIKRAQRWDAAHVVTGFAEKLIEEGWEL